MKQSNTTNVWRINVFILSFCTHSFLFLCVKRLAFCADLCLFFTGSCCCCCNYVFFGTFWLGRAYTISVVGDNFSLVFLPHLDFFHWKSRSIALYAYNVDQKKNCCFDIEGILEMFVLCSFGYCLISSYFSTLLIFFIANQIFTGILLFTRAANSKIFFDRNKIKEHKQKNR